MAIVLGPGGVRIRGCYVEVLRNGPRDVGALRYVIGSCFRAGGRGFRGCYVAGLRAKVPGSVMESSAYQRT